VIGVIAVVDVCNLQVRFENCRFKGHAPIVTEQHAAPGPAKISYPST
jgi:hypothetical protein